MTRLVNDGLPEALFLAIQRQEREELPAGEVSVTQLLQPARARALERQHPELVQLASRKLDALVGTGFHHMVAQSKGMPGTESWITEQRWATSEGAYRVSGGVDLYMEDCATIEDYKTVPMYTCWMVKLALEAGKDRKEEKCQQLNLYAELVRRTGKPVERLRSVFYLKGWNRRDAKKMDLPKRYAVFDVPLWPSEEATAFLRERLRAHEQAMVELPQCPEDQLWGGTRCTDWCPCYPICTQANPALAVPEDVLLYQLEATLAAQDDQL